MLIFAASSRKDNDCFLPVQSKELSLIKLERLCG